MCLQCPRYDASMSPEMVNQLVTGYHNIIQELTQRADFLLKTCNKLEDQYRDVGFFYHTTQYSAREAMAQDPNHQDDLINLEDVFELADPDEYTLYFHKIDASIKRLTKLRSDMTHVPSNASLTDLSHAINIDFLPAFEEVDRLLDVEKSYLMHLAQNAKALRIVNMQQDMNNPNPNARPWYFKRRNPLTGATELWKEAEEWDSFFNWVACLPETRRSVEAGRDMRSVALAWLWSRDDMLVPGDVLSR